MSPKAITIVLIHGLWLSPQSFELFEEYYRSRGYEVLVPAWPRMGDTVEETRHGATLMAGMGTAEILEHYERLLEKLDTSVILIGHSFGGLMVQLLLDRGWGAAGVAIGAPAPRGVLRYPFAQLRGIASVFANPFNYRHSISLPFNRFRTVVANTLDQFEAQEVYDRYAVPASARLLFEVAYCNLLPRSSLFVDFGNHKRAPLLLVSGGEDHLVPTSITRRVLRRHDCSNAVTDFKEFSGRSHLMIVERGWEEVASYTLAWTLSQTRRRNHYRLTDSLQRLTTAPISPPVPNVER